MLAAAFSATFTVLDSLQPSGWFDLMSVEYLFPCECGHQIPVETTQAGQDVTCPECNTTLELPSLSKLRNLERRVVQVDNSEKQKKNPGQRSQAQAFVFAGGLIAMILGMIGVVGLGITTAWFYREPPQVPEQQLAFFRETLESKQPSEIYDVYTNKVRNNPPGDFEPHSYLTMKRLFDNFLSFTTIAGCIAGAGLLAIVLSFLLPGKKSSGKKRADGKRVAKPGKK